VASPSFLYGWQAAPGIAAAKRATKRYFGGGSSMTQRRFRRPLGQARGSEHFGRAAQASSWSLEFALSTPWHLTVIPIGQMKA
jgi:hypothetical protein